MPRPRDDTSVNSSSKSLESNDPTPPAPTEVTKQRPVRRDGAKADKTAGAENVKRNDSLARDDLPEAERVDQQNDFA